MALATPEIATLRIRAKPFGAAHTADWSLSGIGIASIAMTFLEPDPTVVWDEERFAAVRRALESDDLARTQPG